MNDCVNAEFRDQLPALLHERLASEQRVVLAAHVASCADCREELELLRALNGMFAEATPRIDSAAIVSALPAPPLPEGVLPFRQGAGRRRLRRLDWRVAAAIGVLAVGGSSLALARHAPTAAQAMAGAGTVAPQTDPQTRTVASAMLPVGVPVAAAPSTAIVPAVNHGTRVELSMTGRLDDLSAEQLQTLLDEIDELQATPLADPEPVVVPVTLTTDGGPPVA
jgi:hypothetical protein